MINVQQVAALICFSLEDSKNRLRYPFQKNSHRWCEKSVV